MNSARSGQSSVAADVKVRQSFGLPKK